MTDFEDSDSLVCVPRQVVDEMYCTTHDKIKPHWGLLLTPFHRFPRHIRWKEGKKWFRQNTFSAKKDYVGIKLQFACAQQKDGCIAQSEWTSLGLGEHADNFHVVFEITFRKETDVILNKHIHPQGSHAHSSKRFPDIRECCELDIGVLPSLFKPFADRAAQSILHKDLTNPIRTSMMSNLNAFKEDSVAFRSGLNVTSYNQA